MSHATFRLELQTKYINKQTSFKLQKLLQHIILKWMLKKHFEAYNVLKNLSQCRT
jgi:hypothetical protein